MAEDWQGRGLAGLAMSRFLADVRTGGFALANRQHPRQYPGPVRLYEKSGFSLFREGRVSRACRKELLTERMDGL